MWLNDERFAVQLEVDEQRRVVGVAAAVGQRVRLGEVLERHDQDDDQVVEQDRRHQRDRDPAEERPWPGAVDPRRLVHLGRDRLEAGDVDEHEVADRPTGRSATAPDRSRSCC